MWVPVVSLSVELFSVSTPSRQAVVLTYSDEVKPDAFFLEERSVRGLRLATHLHLLMNLLKNVPLLPCPVYAFLAGC